jgi:hypothetical protein
MDAISRLLEEARPVSVSLYNDGSLLNPEEFASARWDELCLALRNVGTRRLQIESIPRFVFGSQLARIRGMAGLETISISMGLQTIGNSFSVENLGRPDVDGIFERAIAEAHEVDAKVRLYLLWGFGSSSQDDWAYRLAESLEWALSRGVERLTICPYVETGNSARTLDNSICALRATLAVLRVPTDGRVDVSMAERPSCGLRYAGHHCAACENALRCNAWCSDVSCERIKGVALGTN